MWQYIPITKSVAQSIPRGLRMDGVNDGAEAPSSPLYDIGTGDFTVAVKFMAIGSVGSARMMHKLTSGNGFSVTNDRNTYSFAMRPHSSTISRIAYSVPGEQGVPVLLSMSRQGDPRQASSFSLYRDGMIDAAPVLSGPWPLSTSSGGDLNSPAPLSFNGSGSYSVTPCYYFFGAFWRRALTPEEHADLYLGIMPADGALSAWRFDKREGLVIEELGGSGLNLGVTGLATSEHTYGSLNNAWVPDSGILYFGGSNPLTQVFTADREVQVTHLYCFYPISGPPTNTLQYSHQTAAGVEVSNGSLAMAPNAGQALPLTMQEGERLVITMPARGNYTIEVHYN